MKVTLDFADTPSLCRGFALRLVRGVNNGPSPKWLQQRLIAIGLRPINALVDITNYITFDRGRPLHVFDAAKVAGDLVVRRARDGEKVLALDGREYALTPEMCVIADDNGVESIAGIMGGEHSGCDAATTDVLIESALWEPLNIARTGRTLGIITDARYRFERGVDPEFMVPGLELATEMVLDFCGGTPTETEVVGYSGHEPKIVIFPTPEVKRLTGLDVPGEESIDILTRLGFSTRDSGYVIDVAVPSWRPDIDGKADLVEEVMRIHGVDKIPAQPLASHDAVNGKILTALQIRTRAARRALAVRGMMEAVTWSFIPDRHAELFGGGSADLKLSNPIAFDMSSMRPSLLPGLLAAAQRNADKGIGDVALFEVSGIYEGDTPDSQRRVAAGVRRGTAKAEGTGRHWSGNSGPVGVFDAKADAFAALEAAGAPVDRLQIETGAPGWYHPGRSGTIKLGPKTVLGHFGEFHPKTLEALDVANPLCGFEVYRRCDPRAQGQADAHQAEARAVAVPGGQARLRLRRRQGGRGRHADARRGRGRPQADIGRLGVRRVRGRRARRRQEVDRHRGVDPAGRQDADRRGFRGARRPHRRQCREADGRRAADLKRGARAPLFTACGLTQPAPLPWFGSAVDERQCGLRIALARHLRRRQRFADCRELAGVQRDFRRRNIVLEMAHLACTGDRHDEVALVRAPRRAPVAPASRPLSRASRLQRSTNGRVRFHVLGLEARQGLAPVVVAQLFRRADRAGQQAAAERAVGHEADAELAAERQAPPPPAPGSTANTRSARAAIGCTAWARRIVAALASESPSARTLPCAHQLGHRADRLLDRHAGIDPVLVVEVDRVDAEPPERGLGDGLDMSPAGCRHRPCARCPGLRQRS